MTLVAATPHHAAAMALIHGRAFPPGERWGADAIALQLAMPGAYGWIFVGERVGVSRSPLLGDRTSTLPGQGSRAVGVALQAPLTPALSRSEREAGGVVLARVVADEAEILTLAVDPLVRRQGAGRLLLQAAMDDAWQRGAAAMFLEAASSNAAALALYGSAGFVQVGRRPRYYPGDDDALVLRGLLNPGAAAEAACHPPQD